MIVGELEIRFEEITRNALKNRGMENLNGRFRNTEDNIQELTTNKHGFRVPQDKNQGLRRDNTPRIGY